MPRAYPGSRDRPSLAYEHKREGGWVEAENAEVPAGARVLADNVTMRGTTDDAIRIIVT